MIAGYSGPLIGVGALCLCLLNPARVWANTPGYAVTLEYASAPSCPGAAALEAVVVARLGYDPFSNDAPHHVFLSIVPNGASFDGRIEWRDAEGKWAGDRTFSMASGDCLRLTRTMGLALAVQIQLLAAQGAVIADDRERAPEAEPPPKPAAKPPESKPDAGSTPPRPKDDPRIVSAESRSPPAGSRLVFAIGAGPSIGIGMAPSPIPLGRVFGVLAGQHASLELGAEVSLPATARRADGAGISARLLLLSVAGCEAIERWNGCLVLKAGEVSLAGEDIDRPTSTRLPLVDAGVRVGFSQPLGAHAFVNAHAEGLAILTRWTASLDDVPVWTVPRFALALGIDLGVWFR